MVRTGEGREQPKALADVSLLSATRSITGLPGTGPWGVTDCVGVGLWGGGSDSSSLEDVAVWNYCHDALIGSMERQ